jgi:hypothetical protein
MHLHLPRKSGRKISPKPKGDSLEEVDANTGTQLLELIRLLLDAESGIKKSLEARAIAVITASGALVTILLAIISWSTQQHGNTFSGADKILLAIGISFLLLSAFLGLGVNVPSWVEEIYAVSLSPLLLDPLWGNPADDTRREITKRQLLVLISAQAQNKYKSRLLISSVLSQIIGLSTIALSVLKFVFS